MTSPSTADLLREALKIAEEAKHDPTRFYVYRGRELDFVRDVFGIEEMPDGEPTKTGLTKDQVKVFLAAFAHRRVAVKSGHGTGKSFVLALIALTWLYVWGGIVATTATTWTQVEEVLWREMSTLYHSALVYLPAEKDHPLLTELKVSRKQFATGRSTSEPTAWQGLHTEHLLVIIDEAIGVETPMHKAIRSLATGGHNHILMVSNPTEAAGAFYEAFRKGRWHRITISCLDHPNVLWNKEIIPGAVTREFVEEVKQDYGEDSPEYQSRVLGEFPEGGNRLVIPATFFDRGTRNQAEREEEVRLQKERNLRPIFALDVARYGSNKSALAIRRGRAIEKVDWWARKDTMETVGLVVQMCWELLPEVVVVDEVGLGAGVVDRLMEVLSDPPMEVRERGVDHIPVLGFNSGRPAAAKTQFQNRRAEMWWRGRTRLEAGELLLPDDDQLRKEMTAPSYRVLSSGKTQVESKEDLLARGFESPDLADAVLMTLMVDELPYVEPSILAPNTVQDHNQIQAPNDDQQYSGGIPLNF